MNMQEMFDKAVAGLASQEFKASSLDGTCVYRGDNGRKCAVGWLIEDELYRDWMESVGAKDIAKTVLGAKNQIEVFFIYDLQQAHDGASSFDGDATLMKARLKEVGERYRLQIPEVLES